MLKSLWETDLKAEKQVHNKGRWISFHGEGLLFITNPNLHEKPPSPWSLIEAELNRTKWPQLMFQRMKRRPYREVAKKCKKTKRRLREDLRKAMGKLSTKWEREPQGGI